MYAAFLVNLDHWLQAGTSVLVFVATVLGFLNKSRLKRVEKTVHASNENAKAAHNALVELADLRTQELADHIGPGFKFPPETNPDG